MKINDTTKTKRKPGLRLGETEAGKVYRVLNSANQPSGAYLIRVKDAGPTHPRSLQSRYINRMVELCSGSIRKPVGAYFVEVDCELRIPSSKED